ncbi:MAG TPA: undecaprenyldiphospho-muramoylpentapeptide beta-N-acetylglucosaminyltransferase [Spirochaetota bacterium]|nr:undecaprenyldiphospho-muramoylpentapeptide beta-N-acetylglucosaminyltransferase [Spirochaetota bacterium]
MARELKIVFTGGGSGGHAMPAVSLIKSLQKYSENNDIKLSILYIGSKNGIEKKIIANLNVNYKSISTGKLRRYFSFSNFFDIFRILKGLFDSFFIIKKFSPDLLFSTGGFVSVPPVIAAKLLKKKVIIHEQTIDAGLANKISSKFADKICITFKESLRYFPNNKTVVTGIPLRENIFEGNKDRGLERFGFDKNLPTVFFTGGGLGCHILNRTALKIMPQLLEKTNVIFQTGGSNNGNDFIEMKKIKEELPSDLKKRFVVYDFVNEELGDVFKITDLAVARSGAGTVCELIALKIPAIFIPLSIATNNEQYKNAEIMKNAKAAKIIEENILTESILYETINDILFSDSIKKMKESFKNIEDTNGREKILNLILETA